MKLVIEVIPQYSLNKEDVFEADSLYHKAYVAPYIEGEKDKFIKKEMIGLANAFAIIVKAVNDAIDKINEEWPDFFQSAPRMNQTE